MLSLSFPRNLAAAVVAASALITVAGNAQAATSAATVKRYYLECRMQLNTTLPIFRHVVVKNTQSFALPTGTKVHYKANRVWAPDPSGVKTLTSPLPPGASRKIAMHPGVFRGCTAYASVSS